MYEIKKIPSSKPILFFKWEGAVTVESIEKSTVDLLKAAKSFGKKYYFIADAQGAELMSPDTQKALVEQQKAVIDNIILSAVILGEKAIQKMQIGNTGRQSGTKSKEQFFANFEEAVKYIESL